MYGRTLLSFCLLRRLPIGLASERRITVRLVLFLKRLMVGLFVEKTTNRACEWGETYGRTCFIFLLLFSWPTLGLKKKKILLQPNIFWGFWFPKLANRFKSFALEICVYFFTFNSCELITVVKYLQIGGIISQYLFYWLWKSHWTVVFFYWLWKSTEQ